MNLFKVFVEEYKYSKKHGILNPWYIILWRTLWFVPVKVALLIATLFVFIGFGKDTAEQVWDSLR